MANNVVPKTRTPENVYIFIWWAIIILIVIPAVLALCGSILAVLFLVTIFALLAFKSHWYSESSLEAFSAMLMLNKWSGDVRILFPGTNMKLPWEKPDKEKKYIDLHAKSTEVKDETYPTLDTSMVVGYICGFKPDTRESFKDYAGEKILKFCKYEEDVILSQLKALFSGLLATYYGEHNGKDLLNELAITEEIFGCNEMNPNPKIRKFEFDHGVEVFFRVVDSDFSKPAEKFRDMISGAKSLAEAIAVLMKDGMSREQAEINIKLMNTDGNYKQNDVNLNVNASGLENLEHLNIVGTGGITPGNKPNSQPNKGQKK